MQGLVSRPLLWLCASVSLAAATSIVYVTDLTIFTQLVSSLSLAQVLQSRSRISVNVCAQRTTL
jgi:hypothetical protein